MTRVDNCTFLPGKKDLSVETCLCQRHQNFALKLRAVLSLGYGANPGAFCDNVTLEGAEETPDNLTASAVKFDVWRKQNVPYDERTVKRICLVKGEMGKEEFVKHFFNEMSDFKSHSLRVKTQYSAARSLKERMPVTHLTL